MQMILLSAVNSLNKLTFEISEIMNKVEIWFNQISLRLNVDKTKKIIGTTKASPAVEFFKKMNKKK